MAEHLHGLQKTGVIRSPLTKWDEPPSRSNWWYTWRYTFNRSRRRGKKTWKNLKMWSFFLGDAIKSSPGWGFFNILRRQLGDDAPKPTHLPLAGSILIRALRIPKTPDPMEGWFHPVFRGGVAFLGPQNSYLFEGSGFLGGSLPC